MRKGDRGMDAWMDDCLYACRDLVMTQLIGMFYDLYMYAFIYRIMIYYDQIYMYMYIFGYRCIWSCYVILILFDLLVLISLSPSFFLVLILDLLVDHLVGWSTYIDLLLDLRFGQFDAPVYIQLRVHMYIHICMHVCIFVSTFHSSSSVDVWPFPIQGPSCTSSSSRRPVTGRWSCLIPGRCQWWSMENSWKGWVTLELRHGTSLCLISTILPSR